MSDSWIESSIAGSSRRSLDRVIDRWVESPIAGSDLSITGSTGRSLLKPITMARNSTLFDGVKMEFKELRGEEFQLPSGRVNVQIFRSSHELYTRKGDRWVFNCESSLKSCHVMATTTMTTTYISKEVSKEGGSN